MIDSFDEGGTERLALQLVRQLHERGRCRMRIACLQKKGVLRAEADGLGLGEIPEFPLTSFYDLNFVVQLRRLELFLKENEIDVIHTHCFYTNVFGMTAGAIARVPGRVAYKGETDGFRSSKQKLVERGAFRLAHRVVANSEAVRQQLIREGVSQDKVLQHYNGLDLARVTVSGGLERKEALSMLGLPQEPARRFITVVANLQHAVKDHPTFLRAAARVRAAIPDVAFVLAGEGDLMSDLRELAKQLGLENDVFFIGRCQNIAELLFASEVGVLSSTAEGFSNAILEYMAAGRPVVVTDVGGAREAVEEGASGYIVRSGNDEEMADRIIQLLNNPAQARFMGERGRLIVKEKFSSRQHLENTIELYEELLSQPVRALASNIPGAGHQRA